MDALPGLGISPGHSRVRLCFVTYPRWMIEVEITLWMQERQPASEFSGRAMFNVTWMKPLKYNQSYSGYSIVIGSTHPPDVSRGLS
jgi:hypothetical protein